ncbi:MAG: BamA/TamA family outer membrane protein [Myxococcota bacterium]
MVWVLCVLAIGSGEETPKDTVEPVEDARSGFDVALSPSIAVTPQTSLLLGLGTIAYGEDPDLDDPMQSALFGLAYVTFRRQWGIAASGALFFGDDAWLLDGTLNLFDGASFFFGVGDSPVPVEDRSEFNVRDLFADVALARWIFDTLYIGPVVRAQRYRARDVENDELRALDGGVEGDQIGAGLRLIWDRRDDALWPSDGTFLRSSVVFYHDDIGSDFRLTEFEVDGRLFVPLAADWVLGVNAVMETRRGDVPFFRQTLIGGPNRLRGTFSGRFRDEASWFAQTEIRSPIFWWALSAAVFAGTGAVATSLTDFSSAEAIVAGGAGLRIALGDEEDERGANLRLDYAVDSDNDQTFYVALGEAF